MTKLSRALPAALVMLLPFTFLVCKANTPTGLNPFQPGVGGGGASTSLPSFTVTASKSAVNADGSETAVVTGTARNAQGALYPSQQVIWSVSSPSTFTSNVGTLSSAFGVTDPNGQVTTTYKAPLLDFVPTGAFVAVTGTLVVPGNPQGSPRASATIVIRPKGTAAPGSGDGTGGGGTGAGPSISAVTPSNIKVDAVPAITVIVQGENFAESSVVLISTPDGLFTAPATYLSVAQLRFTIPSSVPKEATPAVLFVTGPGNSLSDGFPVQLTTGVGGTDGSIDPTITAILPNQGPVSPATSVLLLGDGFDIASCGGNSRAGVVMVGPGFPIQTICPPQNQISPQRIQFTAPAVATNQAGPVEVFVTNTDLRVTNRVTFTYVAGGVINAPTISALSPNSGPTTGGTRVLITGTNFTASDAVVIAGPNIESEPGDTCTGDGLPVCQNNQCNLSASRGTCTINGTAYPISFRFIGSGQIEVIMPSVGTNAAGLADVLIRTTGAATSNIVTFNYLPPAELRPPEILDINQDIFAGDGCCPQGTGLSISIVGRNFRKCSSVFFGPDYEILPTPDIDDCGIRRGAGATESPRERLQQILPPDGMTIRCTERPDLVPLNSIGGGIYRHDSICNGVAASPFSPADARMLSSPTSPTDITSGGAFTWISESQIRVHFGPGSFPPCASSITRLVYVSNDPGRGLSGDLLSNGQTITYTNTLPCPTPTPAPTFVSLSPTSGNCSIGSTPFTIFGTNFIGVASDYLIEFGAGNLATVSSVTSTRITGVVPIATAAVCGSYTCPVGATCPNPPNSNDFECQVPVFVSGPNGGGNFSFVYQSNSTAFCL